MSARPMKSLPGLREEVARHIVLGVLAVGMGVYILLVVDKTLPSMIAALLFLTGGVYWSVAAIPVARNLLTLLRTEEPVEMQLTVRGRERTLALNKEHIAELRYPETPAGAHWDIRLYLRPQPGLALLPPATMVRVYGAREQSGPVIIELDKRLLWSSLLRPAQRHNPA